MEQLRENLYYQYFIGLHDYLDKEPFAPLLLVEFRKRLTEDVLNEINEMIIAYNNPDDPPGGGSGGDEEVPGSEPENPGMVILDATCAPQQISFPQDINLLNEARENLERRMIIVTIIVYIKNVYLDWMNNTWFRFSANVQREMVVDMCKQGTKEYHEGRYER